jgi:hypothetical protein
MNRLAQFVQDRLSAARFGSGGTALGTALGLTFGRVACFPVLTALKEGEGTFLHQGLLWKMGEYYPLMIILRRPRATSQCLKQPEKYFLV